MNRSQIAPVGAQLADRVRSKVVLQGSEETGS